MLEPLCINTAPPCGYGRWHIDSRGSVPSTNDLVKERIRFGAALPFCAVALAQDAGYGRQGRCWSSPIGGLYLSIGWPLVRPLEQAPTVSLAAAVAVVRAIDRVADDARLFLKWPNDILAEEGKICGISLEALYGCLCIGVGVNVFALDGDDVGEGKYRRASLFPERADRGISSSQRLVLEHLALAEIEEMGAVLSQWDEEGLAPFLEEYRSRMAYLGAKCSLELVDGSPVEEGSIEGVGADGRLVVRRNDGSRARFASGEVHLRSIGSLGLPASS